MKTIKTLLIALFLFAPAFSAAATDCNKATIGTGEIADLYLVDYKNDCTEAALKQLLKKYGLPETVKRVTSLDELKSMQSAWKDISAAFATLSLNVPQNQPAVKMQAVYAQLKQRADGALLLLTGQLAGNPVPDVSLLGHVAWDANNDLLFLEVPILGGAETPLIDVKAAVNDDCAIVTVCPATLAQGRQLMLQWKLASHISSIYSQGVIEDITAQVIAKDELWTQYLYDSKPMLPFDFMLTDFATGGWSKRKEFPEGFRTPPKTQWFLLHPAAAVEYSSDALDGEQMKPTLYVELIGVNRWNPAERWMNAPVLKWLSGVSLIASYADRSGIKDEGYGVLLTFNNVYSVGAARYDEETGIFLSLDLANLLREKYKPKYEAGKEPASN